MCVLSTGWFCWFWSQTESQLYEATLLSKTTIISTVFGQTTVQTHLPRPEVAFFTIFWLFSIFNLQTLVVWVLLKVPVYTAVKVLQNQLFTSNETPNLPKQPTLWKGLESFEFSLG